MRTVEAIIETTGEVRLVEPVQVSSPTRALVTILEEAPTDADAALLSEPALAEDWNRAEEDAAWMTGISDQWAEELRDPRQDIYTLADGEPVDPA